MRTKQFPAIVICVVLICSSTVFAQTPTVSPMYATWAKHEVGSSVTMKNITKQAGNALATVELTQTLLAKNDTEVKIEQSSKTLVSGVNIPAVKTTMTFKKEMPKVAQTNTKNVPKPKITKGKETLKIDGKSIECDWIETTMTIEGNKIVSKTWTNDKVPGMTVKSVTNMSNGITTEIVVTKISSK